MSNDCQHVFLSGERHCRSEQTSGTATKAGGQSTSLFRAKVNSTLPLVEQTLTRLLFRCLRHVLLRAQLLILSIVRFYAEIYDASFFVFKGVPLFAIHGGVLKFVVRKGGVEFLLFCRLRRVRTETGLGEQRWRGRRLHGGAARKEDDAAGSQDENDAYCRFHYLYVLALAACE